eukprot:c694_g2_i1 orf=233-691(+)
MVALLCTFLFTLAVISLLKCVLRFTRFRDFSDDNINPAPTTRYSCMKRQEVRSLPIVFYSSCKAPLLQDKKNAASDQIGPDVRTRSASSTSHSTACAICLLDFIDGDLLKVLPACGHSFHIACIDVWLASRSSCPVCRMHPLAREDINVTRL